MKTNSDGSRKGEKNLTSQMAADWVNTKFDLSTDNGYTDVTIRNWLKRLGFFIGEDKKLLYFDGHERPDVIEHRTRYCQLYKEYEKDAVQVDPNTFEVINLDGKYIFVFQDETSKNTYERIR